MSIYVINWHPDKELILRQQIKEYLATDIKFRNIYPNFGGVRVSSTHPFAHLVNEEINNTMYDDNLFPSITVVETDDMKNPEINIPTLIKDITIRAEEVADIVNKRDHYIVSDSDLTTLQTLTSGDNYVLANGSKQERRGNYVIEIWSENDEIKSKLYNVLLNFLTGYRRFTIKENYDIVIVEDSITGQKDGNYNFDFGKMLYGSIIKFNIDYTIAQYYIDTDIVELNEVIHTVEEINGE